ncbi:hypothetical protein C8J57DRAFT_1352296 [Mycena rebaudengoi]|nr:hypothetical protein C8J57DRAFT_1352296 [Mycena rebaudengoi]
MLRRRRRMLFDDMLRLRLCAPCICLLVPNPRHRAIPRSQHTPQLTADIALMASITFFAATIGHSAPNTQRGLAQRRPNTPPDDADIIAAPAVDLPQASAQVACIHNREDVLGGRLRVGPARLGAVLSAGVARPAVFSQDGGEGSGKGACCLSFFLGDCKRDRSRGDRQGRRRAHSRRRGRGVWPMGSHTGTDKSLAAREEAGILCGYFTGHSLSGVQLEQLERRFKRRFNRVKHNLNKAHKKQHRP